LFEEVRQVSEGDKGQIVNALCQMTGMSRASYYRWRVPPPSIPVEMELRDAMQQIALEFSAYGYRRITMELNRRGFAVNHKHVLRLMRQGNLLCLRRRSFVVTTDSRHNLPVYPNLAAAIAPVRVNQLWRADITYIRLRAEFVYLAVVLDASQEYTDLLKQHGAQISMSRKGNPYDNAACESFMKTLKYEEVYRSEYRDLADAYAQIGEFLERVYNQQRLHSALGYVPPAEFEQNGGSLQ
jgi:transposase InsO family protein